MKRDWRTHAEAWAIGAAMATAALSALLAMFKHFI